MSQLHYDVLVHDGLRRHREQRLPDGSPIISSPVSSTLIYGEHDAVLVDPPFTYEQVDSIGDWIDQFWQAPKTKDSDVHVIMILAQAAFFDPDPTQPYGVRLPVTMDTCELIPERWSNWLAWDPLTLVETHGAGMKALKGLYIDCGDIDQYNLVYGARRMHRRLDALGVPHVYEEFPDNHSSVDYRMDISLPFLAKALS